ncbi:hypothetical protein [Streptomyces sp. Rer75]|nr:hypothetical protein [Streptomyces sp. Rer75]
MGSAIDDMGIVQQPTDTALTESEAVLVGELDKTAGAEAEDT